MSAQEKTAGGLSRRNLWAYPVGTVGRDMAGCMFTNYLLTYVLFTKTLTSVQFACISVIMVAARVFDAFNDPIMGNVWRPRARAGANSSHGSPLAAC